MISSSTFFSPDLLLVIIVTPLFTLLPLNTMPMSDSDQVFCLLSLSLREKNVGTEYVHTSQCTSAVYLRLTNSISSQDMIHIYPAGPLGSSKPAPHTAHYRLIDSLKTFPK